MIFQIVSEEKDFIIPIMWNKIITEFKIDGSKLSKFCGSFTEGGYEFNPKLKWISLLTDLFSNSIKNFAKKKYKIKIYY